MYKENNQINNVEICRIMPITYFDFGLIGYLCRILSCFNCHKKYITINSSLVGGVIWLKQLILVHTKWGWTVIKLLNKINLFIEENTNSWKYLWQKNTINNLRAELNTVQLTIKEHSAPFKGESVIECNSRS